MSAITSTAPEWALRVLAGGCGPNPAGSKLTDTERLHLVHLIASMKAADDDRDHRHYQDLIISALTLRGITTGAVSAVLEAESPGGAVSAADRIAVHPELRALGAAE